MNTNLFSFFRSLPLEFAVINSWTFADARDRSVGIGAWFNIWFNLDTTIVVNIYLFLGMYIWCIVKSYRCETELCKILIRVQRLYVTKLDCLNLLLIIIQEKIQLLINYSARKEQNVAKWSKILLDLKITLFLNYQNNFVGTLKIMSNVVKNFDIRAINY